MFLLQVGVRRGVLPRVLFRAAPPTAAPAAAGLSTAAPAQAKGARRRRSSTAPAKPRKTTPAEFQRKCECIISEPTQLAPTAPTRPNYSTLAAHARVTTALNTSTGERQARHHTVIGEERTVDDVVAAMSTAEKAAHTALVNNDAVASATFQIMLCIWIC